MGDGLERGLVAARSPVPDAAGTGVRRLPSVIVLLSDGKNTSGQLDPMSVARQAGQAHIPVYTIALGTPGGEVQLRDSFGFLQRVQVPPDTETLKEIASASGGKAYTATAGDKLKEIYAGLGTRLSSRSEKREVTAAFAGGALVLLIAAGSLSLRWFGRLI
jgi:Ca-activated chloride channel family protein